MVTIIGWLNTEVVFSIKRALSSLEHSADTPLSSISLSLVKGIDNKKIGNGHKVLLYSFSGKLAHVVLLIKGYFF